MSEVDRLEPEKKPAIERQKWLLAAMGIATIALTIACFQLSNPAVDLHPKNISAIDELLHTPSQDTLTADSDWASQLSRASSKIAEKILPAVVSIEVRRDGIIAEDEELTTYFGQLPVPKNADTGSGFFVRSDGWILTNYHVVRQAEKIEVIQMSGERSAAKIEAFDAAADIAILKIDTENHPYLEWANQSPTTGCLVWVAGSPFGLNGSLSMGIISAMNRTSLSGSPMRDYLQTDAVVNPGHSGGPVVNTNGKVVGIASVILGDEYRGIGFALPSEFAKNVSDQLIDSGNVVRGWIGAQFGQVTAERARRAKVEGLQGAYVERIQATSGKPVPAEQAGLRIGDICTAINNVVVQSQFDLGRSIAMMKPRDIARLQIIRDGQPMTIEVVIAMKP